MNIIKSKAFLGVCLIFLALPFLINFLSCFHAPFASWIEPSPWTKFLGQYLSGFAAFAMLYVAWRTLLTTKEANRPFLVVDIVECGASHAFLRCRNIGHSTATNISIIIDKTFINSIKIKEVQKVLEDINNSREFVLEPNGKIIWDLFCIPSMWLKLREERHNERETEYEFRGERIAESQWKANEEIFKTNPFSVFISYNDYSDTFIVDYNNILEDIEPSKRISDQLFSVSWNLAEIKESLKSIKEKVNGTKQDK